MISMIDESFEQRVQGSAYDRFIRSTCRVRRRYECIQKEKDRLADRLIHQELFSTSRDMYQALLANALKVSSLYQSWSPMWPVKHRKNPSIGSSTVVLDLPNIRDEFCNNLMDWSYTDYLSVAFPRSVYLWYAPNNQTMRIPATNPTCVKWNPEGTEIFIASKSSTFKVTDISTLEVVCMRSTLPCHLGCHITSCAFNPKMPIAIMGCSKGAISLYYVKKGLHFIMMNLDDFRLAITATAFSCDGSHFAVTSMDSLLGVYVSSDLELLFVVTLNGPSRALAWHPWKWSCLVVADCMGCMSLYNITFPNKFGDPEEFYYSTYNSAILAVTFNPLSAELVVSQSFNSFRDQNGANTLETETELNVVASFDRVVDRMTGHWGHVPFLSWSPDGTKLASSGSDETARIWEFMPKDKAKNQKINKSCKLSYMSASLELGARLGLSIR